VEWYQTHQTHGFQMFDANLFAPFILWPLLWAIRSPLNSLLYTSAMITVYMW
jgi:hypothetical protein